MTDLTEEAREELLNAARVFVRAGYDKVDSIERRLLEEAKEADPPFSPEEIGPLVKKLLAQAVAELIREQAEWPAITDYDRLTAAFETLEAEDIVARENFTRGAAYGAAAMGHELVEHIVATGRAPKGYVFFHQYDTENAVEASVLYFNYGSADTDWTEERALAIGRRLYEVLEIVGLKPEWNGDIGRRIRATIDWKRRWEYEVPKSAKR